MRHGYYVKHDGLRTRGLPIRASGPTSAGLEYARQVIGAVTCDGPASTNRKGGWTLYVVSLISDREYELEIVNSETASKPDDPFPHTHVL